MNVSDTSLTRRMLAGDERAFDTFFVENFTRLYRFALGRLDHDADAAEEVAQATICRAIRKLGTYRGEATLFTWLCTFCRHEISDFRRRTGRSERHVDLIEDAPDVRAAIESIGPGFGDPETALDRRELTRLVQVTLDRLPASYGDALEWKYLQDLSVEEIAGRLKVSAKAAESLLTRARAAFRDGFRELTRPPASQASLPGPLEPSS